MRNWKKAILFLGAGAASLLIIYTVFHFVFLDLFVDLWWFQSLQYESYFWLRLFYRFLIGGGFTLALFLIFFFHFWIASSYLGVNEESTLKPGLQKALYIFKNKSVKFYTPLALILAVVVALPLYYEWESTLMFLFGSDSGFKDQVYGNDVSFYLFDYPVFQLIQKELLITAVLIFAFVAVLYFVEHRRLASETQDYPLGAKIHLSILWGFVVLFVVWGFLLDRFSLLQESLHEPVFFGPGFIEIRYYLPLIWLSIFAFLSIAASALVVVFRQNKISMAVLIISMISLVGAVGLRNITTIPNLIERFIVTPNPVKAEKPFMKHNIEATLHAYALDDIETIDFKVTLAPEFDLAQQIDEEHLQNIPVWDRQLLKDVYQQLQGIRPYYRFDSVDEDRYVIEGEKIQVNIAARELNIDKLPKEAKSWENQYLRYTHGYGAVITPAAQSGGKPMDWYLRDLNLHTNVGLTTKTPDIYYGLESLKRAIVPNELVVVGLSGTRSEPMQNYEGKGGVPIPSLFRKMLFAFYFNDEKIFFSTNINTQSKILFRRNIKQRIATLAPYLALDSDPYLVLTPSRFYWVQDAYTFSDQYPVSKHSHYQFEDNPGVRSKARFNYIRNSVKVVVDAYNGTTSFYISDPNDPIIKAYSSAYPGVFKDLNEIPSEIQTHLRYPRDLFYIQMQIYAKYHQVEPALFYQQAETWDFPLVGKKDMKPYYLTTKLKSCANMEEFVLIAPMTPIRRDNLSALAIAGSATLKDCGAGYLPKIAVYKFDKDIQVNGPSQVSALVDQNPEISKQFTLWDQHGSNVVIGRMIVLPVGNSILYVEPVYLISATETKIPELVRIIVAMGSDVVMEKTLKEGFKKLEAKLRTKPQ